MNMEQTPELKFQNGVIEHGRTAQAWCYTVSLLTLGRLIWVFVLRDYLESNTPPIEIMTTFGQGLRTDIVVATYLMLPAIAIVVLLHHFAISSVLASTARWIAVCFVCLSFPVFLAGSIDYFNTFGDTFNLRVFDMFNGNVAHIIDIASKQYGLAWKLPASLLVSLILCFVYWKISTTTPRSAIYIAGRCKQPKFRIVFSICFFLAMPMLLRGSIGLRPLMHRDSCVTSQWVLNQGVLNPYFALKHAWKEHRATLNFDTGRHFVQEQAPEKSAEILCAYLSPNAHGIKEAEDRFVSLTKAPALPIQIGPKDISVDHPLFNRTATGAPNGRPSHIFLMFIESYDAWPFLEKYRPLNLVNEGRALASEGLHLKQFLPGANNSCDSFMTIIQGVHETNKYNQQKLPTSLVSIMQRLGYHTRSINAFGLHLDTGLDMISDQGFDEYYFSHDIKPGGESNHNTIHDRTLYSFADDLNYDSPTFNVLYPQSYHPPFDMDLKSEDCEVPPYPPSLQSDLNIDEHQRRIAYGHLKYTDRCLGEFVRNMNRRFPNALFVITGDHFCRNPIAKNIGIYERSAVPLILYGERILQGQKFQDHVAGSHADVATTIAELVAPAGFSYQSLGQDLLNPMPISVGVGTDYVIFKDAIVSLKGEGLCEPLPTNGSAELPLNTNERIAAARKIHCALHGFGYLLARNVIENGLPQDEQLTNRRGTLSRTATARSDETTRF